MTEHAPTVVCVPARAQCVRPLSRVAPGCRFLLKDKILHPSLFKVPQNPQNRGVCAFCLARAAVNWSRSGLSSGYWEVCARSSGRSIERRETEGCSFQWEGTRMEISRAAATSARTQRDSSGDDTRRRESGRMACHRGRD